MEIFLIPGDKKICSANNLIIKLLYLYSDHLSKILISKFEAVKREQNFVK